MGTFEPTSTTYQFYTTSAFTVAAGTHTIEFLGINSSGGDDTAFLDAVSVAVAANSGMPNIGDAGFESAPVGAGNYQYSPSGSAWTFSGTSGSGSGVSGNDSAFTSGNPNAPQGSQVAFLKQTGTITQAVSGWAADSYTISFDAAARGAYGGLEDFEVLVNGNVVGTFEPTSTPTRLTPRPPSPSPRALTPSSSWASTSSGGDDTAFIDAVSVAVAAPTRACRTSATPASSRPRSAPATTSTAPAARPGPSRAPPARARASRATTPPSPRATPTRPQGSQVAFLKQTGTITQTVSGWAAGSYTISFDAAARGAYGGLEDFEVLVDGNVVGTFEPTSTQYLTLRRPPSPSPRALTPSSSWASTAPAATTPPSSTPSQ